MNGRVAGPRSLSREGNRRKSRAKDDDRRFEVADAKAKQGAGHGEAKPGGASDQEKADLIPFDFAGSHGMSSASPSEHNAAKLQTFWQRAGLEAAEDAGAIEAATKQVRFALFLEARLVLRQGKTGGGGPVSLHPLLFHQEALIGAGTA
jgi:hypothetical protein